IGELCEEGWLERRTASGTYIAGKRERVTGVRLLFHPRARRAGSFGARLLELLCARLDREKIAHSVRFSERGRGIEPGVFPVIWECGAQALTHLPSGAYALLLNESAPDGLA